MELDPAICIDPAANRRQNTRPDPVPPLTPCPLRALCEQNRCSYEADHATSEKPIEWVNFLGFVNRAYLLALLEHCESPLVA